MEPLADRSPEELAQHLLRLVHEVNVTSRALTLYGVPVQMDMVDRLTGPEVHVTAGEWSWPAREPGGARLREPPPGTGAQPPA
jgi:hypothetical protein